MNQKMLQRSFELYVADIESWYARPLINWAHSI
jgi:hypothetical protein